MSFHDTPPGYVRFQIYDFRFTIFARETREMTRKKEKYLVIAPVSDYVKFCIESYKWTKKRSLL